jgi:NRPS condensation-like uncharacterized protein
MPVKEHKKPKFQKFLNSLDSNDIIRIHEFFNKVRQHCSLPKYDTLQIIADFENAIIYLTGSGISLDTALVRLSPVNMGGFYTRPSSIWFKLDTAAKVYPFSMNHGKMAMFRLSMYLKAAVVPEILQMALTFTIKRFPSLATSVKKGLFWHYLNSSKRRYNVEPEQDVPCHPIRISNSGSPAFRVIYYNHRISVEFFHILTDGYGGMIFLKTLVAEYLRLLGINSKTNDPQILDINTAPTEEELQNGFAKVDKTSKTSGFMDKPVLQMSGKLSRIRPCQVIHFKMDASKLKQTANAAGGTVTAYILSKMFLAGQFATENLNGAHNIELPVNMRKYYPLKTLLNFSMYCGIKMDITSIKDTPELVKNIAEQIKTKSAKSPMDEMANSAHRMVKLIAAVPLFIKSPIVKIVYHFLGDTIFTNTLSNLGIITMPPEFTEYIDSMDFVLGTAPIHRISCTLITFGDIATFTISKNTADPAFEEQFYKLLKADGMNIKIERSPLYGS